MTGMINYTAAEDIRAGQHVYVGDDGLLHRGVGPAATMPDGMVQPPDPGRLVPLREVGLYQIVDNAGEWTTALPTEPRWYWAFFRNGKTPVIVQIYLSEQRGWEGTLRASFRGTYYPLDEFSHWLGPLPVPPPPAG